MDIKTIIAEYLIRNRYDGLFNNYGACGCSVKDVGPCGCIASDCECGYKWPGDDDYDFYIKKDKYIGEK
jgi:hypothetical protein